MMQQKLILSCDPLPVASPSVAVQQEAMGSPDLYLIPTSHLEEQNNADYHYVEFRT